MKYFLLGIASVIISAIITFCGIYYFVNYYNFPITALVQEGEEMLGTTLTTILGTDTISGSRTTINNNFTALNNGKVENSTTTMESITSLPNLATIGTISSGVWGGTTIGVSVGGTGSTTLSQYSVLLGSSTNPIFTVQGLGSSGQFLGSNGVGAPPTWQTYALDQGANYRWTGENIFANASTTVVTLLNVAGNINMTGTANWSGVTGTSTFSHALAVDKIDATTATTTVYKDLKIMGNFELIGSQFNGVKWEYLSSDTDVGGWYSVAQPTGAKAAQVRFCGSDTGTDPGRFSGLIVFKDTGASSTVPCFTSAAYGQCDAKWVGTNLTGLNSNSDDGDCGDNDTVIYWFK